MAQRTIEPVSLRALRAQVSAANGQEEQNSPGAGYYELSIKQLNQLVFILLDQLDLAVGQLIQ